MLFLKLAQQSITVGFVHLQQFLELRQERPRLRCVVSVPSQLGHELTLASNVAGTLGNMPFGLRQVVKQHWSVHELST